MKNRDILNSYLAPGKPQVPMEENITHLLFMIFGKQILFVLAVFFQIFGRFLLMRGYKSGKNLRRINFNAVEILILFIVYNTRDKVK